MAETADAIDEWVERVRKTRNSRQLLKTLHEFRVMEWTDLERQKVSHAYMKVLDVIMKDKTQQIPKPEEPAAAANDGPVWYEKM